MQFCPIYRVASHSVHHGDWYLPALEFPDISPDYSEQTSKNDWWSFKYLVLKLLRQNPRAGHQTHSQWKIRYRKRQIKRWIVLSGFNWTDRLPGYTDCPGKFLLIQTAFLAQFFHTVFQFITSSPFLTRFLFCQGSFTFLWQQNSRYDLPKSKNVSTTLRKPMLR